MFSHIVGIIKEIPIKFLWSYSIESIAVQVWPALFTLANQGEWPNGGELDMLEYVPRRVNP